MIRLTRPPCPHPKALQNGNYKHPRNKAALKESTSGKCMYCESHINHIDHADVEHIKPKAADKFPELEFVWDNLGYSCGVCNGNKGDKYDPSYPYIDPYSEDPANHLVPFGALLKHKQGSERGQLTVDDLGLNRVDLLERRSEALEKLQAAIDSAHRTQNASLRQRAIAALKEHASSSAEYSMFAEALLTAHGTK